MLGKDKYRALRVESRTLREGLKGKTGMDERGRSVLNNMKIIAKNKKLIAEQETSSVQDPKTIARSNMIISNCMDSIKSTLRILGADEQFITDTVHYVENNDENNVHYNLLKLLSVRNPGMYARKLAMFKQAMENQRG